MYIYFAIDKRYNLQNKHSVVTVISKSIRFLSLFSFYNSKISVEISPFELSLKYMVATQIK